VTNANSTATRTGRDGCSLLQTDAHLLSDKVNDTFIRVPIRTGTVSKY